MLALALFESEEKEKIRHHYLLVLQKIVLLVEQAPKLSSFLISPLFSAEEKEVFFSLISPPSKMLLFLRLITEKRMISHLKTITNHYERLLYSSMGKIKVRIVVAHAHDIFKSMEEQISTKLEKLLQKKVLLTFETDPSLLGGFQLETNDFYLDSSLKKALADMRNSL